MSNSMKRLYINDIILIICIVVMFSVLSLFFYRSVSAEENESYISVCINGKEYGTYSLSDDTSFNIGETGIVAVISNGSMHFSESDCPDKVCLNMPPITEASPEGTSIICIPNTVTAVKHFNNKGSKAKKDVNIVAG